MKIASPANRRGTAVIVVLAILGILTLYVLANLRTLHKLTMDVQRLEQRHLRRLQTTNTPVVITNVPETTVKSNSR